MGVSNLTVDIPHHIHSPSPFAHRSLLRDDSCTVYKYTNSLVYTKNKEWSKWVGGRKKCSVLVCGRIFLKSSCNQVISSIRRSVVFSS